MDFTPVSMELLRPLGYLLVIIVMACLLRSPWFKGEVGEYKLRLLMRWRLPRNDYVTLSNIHLDHADGNKHIEYVVVSKFGLFVIQTENMQGWIFGRQRQQQWTQKIYKHSSQFPNPLQQNAKRLKALETHLSIATQRMFSVIAFVGDSNFKAEMPDNVTTVKGCIRYIRSKHEVLFSDQEIDAITALLKQQDTLVSQHI